MKITNTSKDIFYTSTHWKNPFSCVVSIKKGVRQEIILSLVKRITAIFVAILAGIVSFGLGAIPAFYSLTADFKARKLSKLTLNSYDVPTGLTNFGSTCWFNSALKFIAISRFFDSAFSESAINSCPPEWQKTLSNLTKVVESVREMKRSVVDTKLLKELLTDLDGLFPHLNVKNRQLDPFDLILPLLEMIADFDTNKELCPQIMQSLWDPHRSDLPPRYNFVEQSRVIQLSLNCTAPTFSDLEETSQGQIDLAALTDIERTKLRDDMNRKCYDSLKNVYRDQRVVNLGGLLAEELPCNYDGQSFSSQKALIHAPQTMLVNFQRVTQNFPSGEMLKTYRAIDIKAETLQHDGHYYTLSFLEYTQDAHESGSPVADIMPSHICTYRIKGATRHLGGASSGHWIFYDCAEDGKVFCHNDSKVSFCPHATALKELAQASLLQLELIKREVYKD